ncbi:YbaK/EbsC family protein [Jatrophihabitans sp. YIM 134969]
MTDALDWQPWVAAPDLLAPPTATALAAWEASSPGATATVQVAAIDPELADTAAFCERYGVEPEQSANCVVVAGRRGEVTRHAACLVLATTRADVNGVVRRRLDARKASFAPLDETVAATSMEYGGITPVGLPGDWPVWLDARVAAAPWIVIGSGVRGSKLSLPGATLLDYPGAEAVTDLAHPV